MGSEQLTSLLESLLNLPTENEVVEFKRAGNGFDTFKLGAYFSALSNEVNLKKRDSAWLIFGINDKDHAIVGTNYKPTPQSLCRIKREIAEGINEGITFNDIFEFIYEGKRVLLFQIPPAPQGIPISYKGHYYGRGGESLVALNISEIESIRSQVKRIDWSAQVIEEATIDDLDETAIQLARSLYISKNRDKEEEILTWDNVSFLNKAKITIKGRI
ncbi:MAG: ATP-binding protein, partial [Parabacteroides gordonii]|nr:ATP-binding protein [Parabacteroides gordonii]